MFHMEHARVGKIGEEVTMNHLTRRGFVLVERNYTRKWGEIDLIMRKDRIIHFIEVKTVSCEKYGEKFSRETPTGRVSRETWEPEENVDRRKLRKFARTVETWLLDNRYGGEWQIDVAAVKLDKIRCRGAIKFIENVIIE